MELTVGDASIRLLQGDITKIPADCVVNAANSELVGGGGVDGTIHRAAGPTVMMELNRVRPRGGCPTGSAVVTRAGLLQAKFIIHAVGPVWRGGGFQEDELLASAYSTSLRLAANRQAKRVSFPSMSTGAYGYPLDKAAPVAVKAIRDFLRAGQTSIQEVLCVLFDSRALQAYEKALTAISALSSETPAQGPSRGKGPNPGGRP